MSIIDVPAWYGVASIHPSILFVGPFVCLSYQSTAAAAIGGFAAKRAADKTAILSRRRRSAANADSAALTVDVYEANTDLCVQWCRRVVVAWCR